MRYKKIDIEYWTATDGSDFRNLDNFVEGIDHEYLLTINKRRSDAAGGGIYDLVIKITENISLLDFANSYVEDGIKVVIGYFLKSLFDPIRSLFKDNSDKRPEIEKVIINFKDCEVILYEVYPKGIEENFEKIMKLLLEFRLKNTKQFDKSKSIHIPIFNHVDSYNLCDFRVKLNVDEPIVKFKKQDYFKYWGIRKNKKSQIYSPKSKEIIDKKFYTQKGYDKLCRKL